MLNLSRLSLSRILIVWSLLVALQKASEITPEHTEQHIKRLISDDYQLYIADLGESVQGNPLKAYVISGIKKQKREIKEFMQTPATLVTSYMHTREPYSIKLIQRLLNQILNNYATDFFVRYLLDNTLLILFPFVNIDGYFHYQQMKSQGFSIQKLENYRKNMNQYGTCKNQWDYGVDINRNFPTAFGTISTSANQCSEQYRGPYPFSEKQSKAIKTLFKKFKITLAIDIHSYGNEWIYPYASEKTQSKLEKHPLYPFYQDLKDKFKALNRPFLNCYETLGYVADGVVITLDEYFQFIDWALDQGALSMAVQIGKNFDQDASIKEQIQSEVEEAFHVVLQKNSISYKRFLSVQGILIIKSTSLIDFQLQFLPEGQTEKIRKFIKSGSSHSFTEIADRNVERGAIFVDSTKIEDIQFVSLQKLAVSAFQDQNEGLSIAWIMLGLVFLVILVIFIHSKGWGKTDTKSSSKGSFRLPESESTFDRKSFKGLDREQISPFGRSSQSQQL